MNHNVNQEPYGDDVREHRKNNFIVKIDPLRFKVSADSTEFTVSVSHNGYQWSGIALYPEEADILIEAIEEYLTINKNRVNKHAEPVTKPDKVEDDEG